MSLPIAGPQYDQGAENRFRSEVERELSKTLRRGVDLEFANGERVILRSPDGSRFALTVDNAGALSTTAL